MMLEHSAMQWGVVAIFVTVYVGMFLGGLPLLKLNRSGVALVGAIAVLGLGVMSTEQAAQAVDLPTILLLFSFMVVSAQLSLAGFYTAVTRWVAALHLGRNALLAALIAVAAVLSAIFSNDIICLAMTPVVARLCLQRQLNPVPFLVGLACAANIGSAATLIGNPQNMLIGSVLQLSFSSYLLQCLPPVTLSLGVLWGWLVWGPQVADTVRLPVTNTEPDVTYDFSQTIKGLVVAVVLLGVFLFTNWLREVAALMDAGVLLLSWRLDSSRIMKLVDWDLLVLFIGLFVVNHAFETTGLASQAVAWLAAQGINLGDSGPLFVATVGLSNLVSNVPAVMLLLPHLQSPEAGVMLALASTLAGNLLLVGSIANLIVVDLARRSGVVIDVWSHARIGVPVTVVTLGVVWGWMVLIPA